MAAIADAIQIDSTFRCKFDSLAHGKPAMLLTAVTAVALAALALFTALYFAGVLATAILPISCAAVVLTSTAILGPKVIYDYIPALCRMVFGFMRGQPKIHPNGTWEGLKVGHAHFFDHKLAAELCKFFTEERAESVVDFGCGTGEYVRKIRSDSRIAADGVDGNPDTPALSKGTCRVQDLSVPFQLEHNYDWVMSFEVGEHLPKQYERIFIENMIRHAEKGIVLSWAKKGQGGHGHVNEQNNDYIKAIFQQKGWINDVKAENRLRNSNYPIYFWFYDTIMVFRKP